MKPTDKNFGSSIRLLSSGSIDYNRDRGGIDFSRSTSTADSNDSILQSHAGTGGNYLSSEQIQRTLGNGVKDSNDNKTDQPVISNLTASKDSNSSIAPKIDSATTSFYKPQQDINSSQNNAIILLWRDAYSKISNFKGDLKKFKSDIRDIKSNSFKVKDLINQQQSKIQDFDEIISKAEQRIDSRVKEFESEVINARNSILAVIALFASFFTFISISVNIFSKDLQLITALSIILLLWSCTLSFIFVFMAGISKGGAYFTSFSFIKHAALMLLLFLFCFVMPKFVFTALNLN